MSRFLKSTLAKSVLAASAAVGGTVVIWILLDQNEPHLATSYKPFNKDIPPPPSRESLIGNLKKCHNLMFWSLVGCRWYRYCRRCSYTRFKCLSFENRFWCWYFFKIHQNGSWWCSLFGKSHFPIV